MKRYLFILILGAGLPLWAQDQPAQKPPPMKEVAKPPAAKPAAQSPAASPAASMGKPDAPPVSPRTRHPFGRPPLPTSARTEYAKPTVTPASSRPPVVWEKGWASQVKVEWEDAPVRMPPTTQAADQPAKLAEDITAIKKQLDELTTMVRALAAAEAAHE